METAKIKNGLVKLEEKRKIRKAGQAKLRRKYFMPATCMLFFSFNAVVSNIVLIVWLMAKRIVRKTGLNKRKNSLFDRIDVVSILASSIFPGTAPSYIKIMGNLSRMRLMRKLKKFQSK